jgi:hypothetical protein
MKDKKRVKGRRKEVKGRMEGSKGKGEGSKIKIGRELKKEEWCSRKVGRK